MTSAMLCLLLVNGFLGGFFGAAAANRWIANSHWFDGRSFKVALLCSVFNLSAAVLGLVLLWP